MIFRWTCWFRASNLINQQPLYVCCEVLVLTEETGTNSVYGHMPEEAVNIDDYEGDNDNDNGDALSGLYLKHLITDISWTTSCDIHWSHISLSTLWWAHVDSVVSWIYITSPPASPMSISNSFISCCFLLLQTEHNINNEHMTTCFRMRNCYRFYTWWTY